MMVCEFCKGSYSTHIFEGSERTYAIHLTFYLKRSLFELKDELPEMITAELSSAIEDYGDGKYSASFRSIGLVAEWITDRLFVKKFGELPVKERLSWDSKLGRLLDKSRKDDKTLRRGTSISIVFFEMVQKQSRSPFHIQYNCRRHQIRTNINHLLISSNLFT